MAYADFGAGNSFLTLLFASAEDRNARRGRKAEYKRKLREIDMMTEKDLADIGYTREQLQRSIHLHYVNG